MSLEASITTQNDNVALIFLLLDHWAQNIDSIHFISFKNLK